MHPLADEIARILLNEGPTTAAALAGALEVDRQTVNRCLYNNNLFKDNKIGGVAAPFWSVSTPTSMKLRPRLASPRPSSGPTSVPTSGSTSPIFDRTSPDDVSPRAVQHVLITAQMLLRRSGSSGGSDTNNVLPVKDTVVVLVDLGNVQDCTIPLVTLMEQQDALPYTLDAHFFADFGTNPHKGKVAIPNLVKATDTDHNAADLEMVWRAKELADRCPKMSTFIIATKDKGLGYLRTLLTREGQTAVIAPDWETVKGNLPK